MKWLLIICLFPLPVFSQLKLAKIFSSNMVLQRNLPIHIYGRAAAGEIVTITFANNTKTVSAKNDSSWEVFFRQQAASLQPQSLLVKTEKEIIRLDNILMGDIWLCIGQSNMEFPLQQEIHYKEEIPNTDQPLIRLFNPVFIGKNVFGKPYTDSMMQGLNTNNFYSGQWQTCDSSQAKTMSAIAYYFGKRIVATENIPTGLIHLAIGGCPLETFISSQTLAGSAQFSDKVKGNWLTNEKMATWVKQRGADNTGAQKIIYSDDNGPNHGFKPGFAYAAGIEPILGLPIKGVLLYQGESNAQEPERVAEYAAMLQLLIKDYRARWKQPALPFYWMQLSSIDTAGYASQLWPKFRDEQRKSMHEIENAGMAVCSDLGARNNVHPTNKKEPAERLARWALHATYHKKSIVPSGPLPETAVFKKGNIIVRFQYAAGLKTSDEQPLRGFSIDGIKDISATINNNQVIIAVKSKPAFVYYGWKPFTDANLVNHENLPASTFKIKVQ